MWARIRCSRTFTHSLRSQCQFRAISVASVPFGIKEEGTAINALVEHQSNRMMAPGGDFKGTLRKSCHAYPCFLPFYMYEVDVRVSWTAELGFDEVEYYYNSQGKRRSRTRTRWKTMDGSHISRHVAQSSTV